VAQTKLQAIGLRHEYYQPRTGGRLLALDNINLQVEDGEFVTIVGPSGCGKTTFINLCDGLLKPTAGKIMIDGKQISGPGTDRGMVFQDSCLMPWRTVFKNVIFGLECQGLDNGEGQDRAKKFIKLVGLQGFEDHYPHELSGGMRQRANIIRTLIYDPELILMDEPFGPLDAQTRIVLQDQLLKLWSASKKTIIFITHDLIEAIALADRVVLMSSRPGRIKFIEPVKIPRPRDVFQIHNSPAFHSSYEKLWQELRPEVKLAEA